MCEYAQTPTAAEARLTFESHDVLPISKSLQGWHSHSGFARVVWIAHKLSHDTRNTGTSSHPMHPKLPRRQGHAAIVDRKRPLASLTAADPWLPCQPSCLRKP